MILKRDVHQFWLANGIALCTLATASPAIAQIAADGTVSTNVTTTDNLNFTITEGNRAGSNLFHSFSEFSVPTRGSAFFDNARDIQNIISRVTGSSASNIDGLITANPSANLFLLNPNGIIFGPNASLNIGGSFVASTASSLNFADGTQFSATAPQTTPLLTVSVPLGLQFGGTIGSIVNQFRATNSSGEFSGLQVQPGKTLALVGGNVSLEGGHLLAPGGRVELGGVAGTGSVGLSANGSELRLSFPVEVRRADVFLTNGAEVNVRAGGGGSIAINAQNLNLAAGSELLAGINSGLGSIGSQAGNIEINATGEINLTNESSIANEVLRSAVGNGGGINIMTGSLSVSDGARLNASTLGQGDAGDVAINARDKISFDGVGSNPTDNSSGVVSRVGELEGNYTAEGQGGNIDITTGSLSVTNGANLSTSTFGRGNAGNVTIIARDKVSFDGMAPLRDGNSRDPNSSAASRVGSTENQRIVEGNGGDITITTGSLSVTNGARLNASTNSRGDAGNVTIIARDTVSFAGVGRNGAVASSAVSRVLSDAIGNGGDIKITTGSLSVSDGAFLSTSTRGWGDAGNVTIIARDKVSFDEVGRNEVRSTVDSTVERQAVGNGGSINITSSTGLLSVTNGAQLSTSSQGSGAAGNIKVAARSINLDSQASLRSDTGAGEQGNVILRSQDLVLRRGSKITTNATGTATGGNIEIDTGVIIALENSDISANGGNAGGRVMIDAQGIFGTEFRAQETLESDITATAERGSEFSGTVEINTPNVDPSQGLVSLPAEVVDASRLIASGCGATGRQGQSEFIVTGRGGLPPTPRETLNSDTVLEDWGMLALASDQPQRERQSDRPENRSNGAAVPTAPTPPTPTPIVEAQGWVLGASGEVLLTATPPTVTPYKPGLAPTDCYRS